MPFQSKAQIIGDAGENWFQSQLPEAWLLQKPTKDVGVDGVVVICERGVLNGKEFRVQIKASENLTIKNSKVILDKSRVKVSTINYWFISPLPTMIVAFDCSSKRGYYCWHIDVYEQVSNLTGKKDSSEIILRLPEQELTLESWENIRESLIWHSKNLVKALSEARNAKSTLPTIRKITAAVRMLNSIGNQPIPIENRTLQQEGMLALLELIQHKDIVSDLTKLLSELNPNCEGAVRLREWISSYHRTVLSVFPNFDNLPDGDVIPPDYQIVFAKNLIHFVRPQLVQSALEIVMLLTPNDKSETENMD